MNLQKTFPILLWIASALYGQFTPEKQIKIVVQGSSSGMPENSFARKPKTIHRLGKKFARIEEDYNPETKLQLLIINKAPNSWMINLIDKTGKKIVDPDPNGNIVFPIFITEEMPKDFPAVFTKLEFGNEEEFFSSYKAPFTPFRPSGQELVKQYVGINGWGVALIRKTETSRPFMIFLFKNNDVVTAFKYLDYQILDSPNMKVFDLPDGIKFSTQPAP